MEELQVDHCQRAVAFVPSEFGAVDEIRIKNIMWRTQSAQKTNTKVARRARVLAVAQEKHCNG